jgi:glycine betaine/choline ABC-type transport system substrate-binding protein
LWVKRQSATGIPEGPSPDDRLNRGPQRLRIILAANEPKERSNFLAVLRKNRRPEVPIGMSVPLGFNDTYAIGMREQFAARLGLITLSDLRRHPELKFGFSNEFMDRADGWPGIRDRYGLPQRDVLGIDHDLAYRAIASGEIHATDLYSTDAEIGQYDLRILRDDLNFFPSY